MPEHHSSSTQFEFRYLDQQRESVLVFSPPNRISSCFIRALEAEFPEYEVYVFNDFSALKRFNSSDLDFIKLVIVHQVMCDATLFRTGDLRAFFAKKPFVLAFDGDPGCLDNARALAGNFDSHLPMDLRLDVWLSIIRLLLSGGNYHHADILNQPAVAHSVTSEINHDTHAAPSVAPPIAGNSSPVIKRPAVLEKLTNRELEVLKLIASGQQNKIIAAELGLSEHTVKLHVHHVISKLGVSNRTEAASLYLGANQARDELC